MLEATAAVSSVVDSIVAVVELENSLIVPVTRTDCPTARSLPRLFLPAKPGLP